jgi:DNA-binding winged helix-turn-helix (wHTH) protein
MISENSQPAKESKTYEFGEFRFDAENLLLFRNSETVQLPIKAAQILLALIEADGRVLKKEEILERVWSDTFVEESNLSHHVAALRKALGEEKSSKKFIETIPRRGYRFVAQVKEIENEVAEITVSERTRTQITEEE